MMINLTIENLEMAIDSIRKINFVLTYKTFVGSFNGLICFRDLKGRICICNPMTKEYVIVPEPMGKSGEYYNSIGFGTFLQPMNTKSQF